MASQTSKSTTTKTTTEQKGASTSERLQDEANQTETRMDLLVPVGKVSNSNRLRFIARLQPLMRGLKGSEESEEPTEEDGGDAMLGMSPETMDAMADFTEFVVEKFAASEQAREELQQLEFEVFLQTTFAYLEDLGESMGSSN